MGQALMGILHRKEQDKAPPPSPKGSLSSAVKAHLVVETLISDFPRLATSPGHSSMLCGLWVK